MSLRPILFALILPLALLAACDNDKDIDPPAELVPLQARMQVKHLWSAGLGGEAERLQVGLRPAFDGTRLYAASHGGDVFAFDPGKGRQLWRVRTKLPLSGGPGVGAGSVVVGSSEGDVVALNAESGAQQWKVHVNGEVLAPPAVTEKVIVVRTVDGRLRGLDAATGSERWVNEQNMPRLSLRGTAAPVIADDMVVAGFDNGKVMAVNLLDGAVLWETQIAPSRGRTELERLVDIDSAVYVADKDIFAVGFQGRAAMLARESGQIWWSRDSSSERGLAVGPEAIYISNSNGDVTALKRRDGAPLWEQKVLHRRGLSGPVLDGEFVVVADFEGYVHWLDAATGEVQARMKTDGKRVTNAPLAADGKIFVLTDGGKLVAFQRGAPIALTDADKKAEAEAVEKAAKKRQEKIEKAKQKADKPDKPDRD